MSDIPPYRPKAGTTTVPPSDKDKVKPKGRPASTAKLAADRPFKSTIPQIRSALQGAVGATIMALSAKAAFQDDEVAQRDADLLTEYGEELVEKWIWLAEKNVTVRRGLELLCGSGGYASFALVNLTIVLGLAQNHGMYPENWPTPSSLKTLMSNVFSASEDEQSPSSSK